MRALRWIVSVLFVVSTVLFTVFYIGEKMTTDHTIPVITVEGELIEVSFNATEEELLQGVTAYDEKDKDLTDRIIVESVSRFFEDGMCKVVYAVCDNDNNVANATRKINSITKIKFFLTKLITFFIMTPYTFSEMFCWNKPLGFTSKKRIKIVYVMTSFH